MKKHIALGIAAAFLGVSGVAGALVSVNQITALGASESGVSVNHDKLAANCWMVTGSANDASCSTSVAGLEVPALPEIADLTDGIDIPSATGLLAMATDAVDTATDAAASAQGIVGGAATNAQGAVAGATPSACKVALPVKLPVSTGIFSTGLNLFHMAQNLAMNKVGLAGVSSPVPLPVRLPVSADDVINQVEAEAGCLAANAGGSLPVGVPSICSVTGGLPAAVTSNIPADVSGLLSSVVDELANLSGQGINVAGGSNLGVNCNLDAATSAVPTPASVTGTVGAVAGTATGHVATVSGAAGSVAGTASGQVGSVAGTATNTVGSIAGAGGTVAGTVDDAIGTVTGAVDDVVANLPGLLPTSTPSCSASGSASIGGLLGSLTSTITGGCK
jgi:hypothetical protein